MDSAKCRGFGAEPCTRCARRDDALPRDVRAIIPTWRAAYVNCVDVIVCDEFIETPPKKTGGIAWPRVLVFAAVAALLLGSAIAIAAKTSKRGHAMPPVFFGSGSMNSSHTITSTQLT